MKPQTTRSNSLPRCAASLLLASLLTGLPATAQAQEQTRAAQPACGTQDADPAAAEPGSLVEAVYEVVSGPAGGVKDWTRLQRLHAPGAMITPTQHRSGGVFAAAPQTLAAFIELNKRLFADRGFFERETARSIRRFGHVAHVWSIYETRERQDGPVQARGVNSFQLLNDGTRWCVLSATWDVDTAGHPLPDIAVFSGSER